MMWIGALLVVFGVAVASHGFRREAAGLPDSENRAMYAGMFIAVCGLTVLLIFVMSTYNFAPPGLY